MNKWAFVAVALGCGGAMTGLRLHAKAKRYQPDLSRPNIIAAAEKIILALVMVVCAYLLLWNVVKLLSGLYFLGAHGFGQSLLPFLTVSALIGFFSAFGREFGEILGRGARWVERFVRRCVATLVALVEQLSGLSARIVYWACVWLVVLLILAALSLTLPGETDVKQVLALLSRMFAGENPKNPDAIGFVVICMRASVCAALCVVAFRIVFAPYWRMVFYRPVINPSYFVGTESPGDALLHIAHLSDLHCPEYGVPLTETKRNWNDEQFRLLMGKLARQASEYDAILLTGDITDRGGYAAWMRFLDRCPKELRKSMVVLPGNHDLNVVGHGTLGLFWWSEQLHMAGRNERCRRYLEVLRILHGDALVWSDVENHPVSVSSFIDREVRWHSAVSRSQHSQKAAPHAEILHKLYPVLVELRSDERDSPLQVLTWNTVKPTSVALFNAFGDIDSSQLERAQRLMSAVRKSTPDAILVHAGHHQIALPSKLQRVRRSWLGRYIDVWQEAGMTIENASELISWILGDKRETVVFHGHHHKHFCVTLQDAPVDIVSASSSTLGCEGAWPKGTEVSGAGWSRVTLRVRHGDARVARFEWIPLGERAT